MLQILSLCGFTYAQTIKRQWHGHYHNLIIYSFNYATINSTWSKCVASDDSKYGGRA